MSRRALRSRPRGRGAAGAAGLSPRAAVVLRAVVGVYLRTGEPVGSAAALKASRLSVSPATIRVIMAELDGAGLLEQPHASAGRVPTPRGLRLYVDHLMRRSTLPESARELVTAVLLEAADGADTLVEAASRHLAVTCTLTALGRRPRLDVTEMRRLELVRIDVDRVLAVAVMADGSVRNRLVRVERPIAGDELQRVQNLFNDRYAGQTLAEARAALRAHLADLGAGRDDEVAGALRLAEQALPAEPPADDAVIVEGRTHFLTCSPSPEEATRFLEALEDKQRLLDLLDRMDAGDGPQIVFGAETAISGLQACTVVGAAYGVGGRRLGTVAIVGPLRMNYARVVPLVGYTAETISDILHASGAAA